MAMSTQGRSPLHVRAQILQFSASRKLALV